MSGKAHTGAWLLLCGIIWHPLFFLDALQATQPARHDKFWRSGRRSPQNRRCFLFFLIFRFRVVLHFAFLLSRLFAFCCNAYFFVAVAAERENRRKATVKLHVTMSCSTSAAFPPCIFSFFTTSPWTIYDHQIEKLKRNFVLLFLYGWWKTQQSTTCQSIDGHCHCYSFALHGGLSHQYIFKVNQLQLLISSRVLLLFFCFALRWDLSLHIPMHVFFSFSAKKNEHCAACFKVMSPCSSSVWTAALMQQLFSFFFTWRKRAKSINLRVLCQLTLFFLAAFSFFEMAKKIRFLFFWLLCISISSHPLLQLAWTLLRCWSTHMSHRYSSMPFFL